MMKEFVLYGRIHARKSFAADQEPGPVPDVAHALNEGSPGPYVSALDGMLDPIKLKTKAANDFEHGNLDLLIPLAAYDLHPCHEVAAVVIQVPLA